MRCRICRTARNLKYTPQQLRLQSKNGNKNKLRLPLSAIPQTTGNICIDCDERLQNFHQLDDDSDVVDVVSDGFHENKKRHVEIPIIVDDDERLYDMFYNKTSQPCKETQVMPTMEPMQSQSLGSDGDAEVIELLTSRETTPELTGNFIRSEIPKSVAIPANPTIIEVIDLETYDETGKDCSGHLVKTEQNETRLLGCLSLVTSDSESEINFEPCPREEDLQLRNISKSPSEIRTQSTMGGSVECTNNNNLNFKNSSVTIQHNLPVCGICGIRLLDKQSLQAHMREHEDYKCAACNSRFHKPLDLVNHMRKKHRSYDGNDLCEGARCSQDSAMTIRLRFMQRFTFYECQLCGLIESQFKAHKTHIMQNHADESKSLRDPMMKTQLKCPACYQNCGTTQLEICRHLLAKHEPAESGEHLKTVTGTALTPYTKYWQKHQDGVRIFTLGSEKPIFFECLLCRKAFGSHGSVSKHLNGHNMDEWKEYKAQKAETTSTSSPVEPKRSLKRKIETRNASKPYSEQIDVQSKKEEQPPAKKIKLEYVNSVKNSIKPKVIPLAKDSSAIRIPANNLKHNFLPPPDIKRIKKLKHKVEKKSQNNRKQPKALTRVKVKPPLRHFPTQKYNCKHCQLSFKGFRKLQLHLLSSHRSDEYHSCENCSRGFNTKASLEVHWAQNICKRKRKYTSMSQATKDKDTDILDENSNKDDQKLRRNVFKSNATELPTPKSHQKQKSSDTPEPKWLKELLQLSREKQLNALDNSNTAFNGDFDESSLKSDYEQLSTAAHTICRYCGQLFANIDDFSMHEKNHIALKDMPWIHYSQRKWELSST